MPNDNNPGAPVLSSGRYFLRRLTSTFCCGPSYFRRCFSHPKSFPTSYFFCIIVLFSGAGLVEFYGLAEKRGVPCFKWCGLTGGLLLLAALS